MNDLTTLKSVPDFKVNPTTGEAFISVTKTAELLGVARSAIQKYIASSTPNYLISKGLTPELLQEVATHYALYSKATNDTAKQFAAILMKAGAKAFIYHQAGYKVQAVPAQDNIPQTHIQAVEPEQVFDLYEQQANSYSREIWEEAYPDAILP